MIVELVDIVCMKNILVAVRLQHTHGIEAHMTSVELAERLTWPILEISPHERQKCLTVKTTWNLTSRHLKQSRRKVEEVMNIGIAPATGRNLTRPPH